MYVNLTWSDFEILLEERREQWNDSGCREVPECIWSYIMGMLEETGGLDPEYNTPSYIVDNIVVNGSWETFEEFRRFSDDAPDDDEELAEVAETRGALAVFLDEKLIFWNTGL